MNLTSKPCSTSSRPAVYRTACEKACAPSPLSATLANSAHASPFFATLTDNSQVAENTATLSPFPAALSHTVNHKSFVCQSLQKTPGGGAHPSHLPVFLFPALSQRSNVQTLKPSNNPHTRSAMAPSILWKKNSPPSRIKTTTALEASSSGPGGWPCPVSAQRNPSITPAMGFSPYSHRHRCGTSELGYATGEANIQNCMRNGTT